MSSSEDDISSSEADAERVFREMQDEIEKENEENMLLEKIRMENDLRGTPDDDDGIFIPDYVYSIPFSCLDFSPEDEVAEGAFGKIFKGEYLGTDVAIKKFLMDSGYPEDDQKYLEREVATIKGIRHPNIVGFVGISQNHGDVYLVTEWVPSGDLTNELRKDKYITWKVRTGYARDVAAAMAYLHQNNIIHRDLKAENLLLTEDGRIKVCDLGFARTAKKLVRRMSIAGTSLYMAPEVMVGADYDFKCDVFGFGVVLFEIIARQPPPKRSIHNKFLFDQDELLDCISEDCPEELLRLLFSCLELNPKHRPTFTQVLPLLKQLLEVLPDDDGIVWDTEEEARKRKKKRKKKKKTNNLDLEAEIRKKVENEILQRLEEEKIELKQKMLREIEDLKKSLEEKEQALAETSVAPRELGFAELAKLSPKTRGSRSATLDDRALSSPKEKRKSRRRSSSFRKNKLHQVLKKSRTTKKAQKELSNSKRKDGISETGSTESLSPEPKRRERRGSANSKSPDVGRRKSSPKKSKKNACNGSLTPDDSLSMSSSLDNMESVSSQGSAEYQESPRKRKGSRILTAPLDKVMTTPTKKSPKNTKKKKEGNSLKLNDRRKTEESLLGSKSSKSKSSSKEKLATVKSDERRNRRRSKKLSKVKSSEAVTTPSPSKNKKKQKKIGKGKKVGSAEDLKPSHARARSLGEKFKVNNKCEKATKHSSLEYLESPVLLSPPGKAKLRAKTSSGRSKGSHVRPSSGISGISGTQLLEIQARARELQEQRVKDPPEPVEQDYPSSSSQGSPREGSAYEKQIMEQQRQRKQQQKEQEELLHRQKQQQQHQNHLLKQQLQQKEQPPEHQQQQKSKQKEQQPEQQQKSKQKEKKKEQKVQEMPEGQTREHKQTRTEKEKRKVEDPQKTEAKDEYNTKIELTSKERHLEMFNRKGRDAAKQMIRIKSAGDVMNSVTKGEYPKRSHTSELHSSSPIVALHQCDHHPHHQKKFSCCKICTCGVFSGKQAMDWVCECGHITVAHTASGDDLTQST
eukprot:CAMPEP_0174255542 /NCGR_PEP_ID=MMETSP0439-20130205/4863_1 /TAXON_ID=0 /ORGANISM="Stereomyxa ramosa, Strain Chinc5" /LENGTH=1026 /DNA_ID=CAMNT_0015337767 /DNA_START=90 /DNA_END=3170 /DNA_ORIENTATION=-